MMNISLNDRGKKKIICGNDCLGMVAVNEEKT